MSDKLQPGIMACPPVAWGPSNIDGATVTKCEKCRCDCHIAPSSKIILSQFFGMKVLCTPCAVRLAEILNDCEFRVLPEQVKEINDQLAKDRARAEKGALN